MCHGSAGHSSDSYFLTLSGYHSGRQRVLGLLCIYLTGYEMLTVTFSVGKTSLMNQYVNKRFSNQYKATIGADL